MSRKKDQTKQTQQDKESYQTVSQIENTERLRPESLVMETDPYMTARQAKVTKLRNVINQNKNLDKEVSCIIKNTQKDLKAMSMQDNIDIIDEINQVPFCVKFC